MGVKTRLLSSGKTEDNEFNIGLLGFKMAVNDGLTVFNLVDGIVDEFHDESGTDEAEGSNDTYCATSDHYINSTSPAGTSVCYSGCISAGFTTSSVTEPDTSTAGANPAIGVTTFGTFTVPAGLASANIAAWGGGAGSGMDTGGAGGGGGYSEGTLAVTQGQVLYVGVGEGSENGGEVPAVSDGLISLPQMPNEYGRPGGGYANGGNGGYGIVIIKYELA